FLRGDGLAADPVFQLLEREAVRLDCDIRSHWPRIRTLMSRYRQMDLADASIVVMTALRAQSIAGTSACTGGMTGRRSTSSRPERVENADVITQPASGFKSLTAPQFLQIDAELRAFLVQMAALQAEGAGGFSDVVTRQLQLAADGFPLKCVHACGEGSRGR